MRISQEKSNIYKEEVLSKPLIARLRQLSLNGPPVSVLQCNRAQLIKPRPNCHFIVHSRNLGKYLDKVFIIVSTGIYQKTCSKFVHIPKQCSRAMEHCCAQNIAH
jgi:hypothetical protein